MEKNYSNNIPFDLIAKNISGNLNPVEQKEFNDWLQEKEMNVLIYDELSKLWHKSESWEQHQKELSAEDIDNAWNKLSKKIKLPAIVKPISGWQRYGKFIMTAAAVLVAVAISYTWLFPLLEDWRNANKNDIQWLAVTNDSEVPKIIQMPDGSTIILNKKTTLRYSDNFKKRVVELDGEAYFEVVEKDKDPFLVQFGKAQVRVLGTSFNIKAYKDTPNATVAVIKGKVSFKYSEHDSVALVAGKAALWNSKDRILKEKILPNAASWKTQTLSFENMALSAVIDALKNHFNQNIELANPELANCSFVGIYEQPKLKEILDALSFSLELKVTKKSDGTYVLEGKGCK